MAPPCISDRRRFQHCRRRLRPGRSITECPSGAASHDQVGIINDMAVLILRTRARPGCAPPMPPACSRLGALNVPEVAPQPLSLGGPTPGTPFTREAWAGQRLTQLGRDTCGGSGLIYAGGVISEVSPFFTFIFDDARQYSFPGDSGGPFPFLDSATGRESVVGVHHGGEVVGGSECGFTYLVPHPNFAATGFPGVRRSDGRVTLSNADFILAVTDPARTGDLDNLLGAALADTSCCSPGVRDQYACSDLDDPDCDGVRSHGNGLDNCPTVYNPDQLNTDGDQLGDACDNCPCVNNQNQGNCNEDVERLAATHSPPILGEDIRGNACDPTHCAGARATSAPIATASLLDHSLRWLAPVERSPQIEPDFPTFVALHGDGSDIASILVTEGGGLRDVREKAFPQVLAAGAVDPPAREDFGAVLSGAATARGVYVVGGRYADGSAPFVMHRFDLATGNWMTYPLLGDPLPDRVLAATVRPEDQSIYLLDRVEGARSDDARVRLLRVGATSGLVALIHVFDGHPHDAWSIAASWDARLVVVRSDRTSQGWYAELATVEGGRFQVVGRANGRGFVSGDVATDDLGVSLMVDDGRTIHTVGVRYGEF